MAMILPTKDDTCGVAADAIEVRVARFEADLTAFELAWLRELELQYVTAESALARATAAICGAFSAPTERCKWLADWLVQLEAEAELTPSEAAESPGGPSTAHLLARPKVAAPSTSPSTM